MYTQSRSALWTLCASALIGCAPDEPVLVTDLSASLEGDIGAFAVATWTQDGDSDATWVEFDVGDGIWMTSPPTARSAGSHREWILGAPLGSEVTWRVVTERGEAVYTSEELTFETSPLDPLIEELPVLGAWVEGETSPEGWLLGSVDIDGGEPYSGPYRLFIADRAGRIVWYYDMGFSMSMFPRLSRTGAYIAFEESSFFSFDGATAQVHRMTLDGRWMESIPTPGLGWTWDELDDGGILYDRHKDIDEITIEEIAADGTQRTIWDCAAWQVQWDEDTDHCFTNTVNWSPETDSIFWSTYWGDYVVEVDRQTGEPLWHAGSMDGGWTIDPETSGFELQHYPNYTPDGTLIVSTHVPGEEGQQRAREFEIDRDGQSLVEIWSYGEGESGYAMYSGEAVRLENGNTLINYGTGGEIREVTMDGETVWSLQWGDTKTLGHSDLIPDLYALVEAP